MNLIERGRHDEAELIARLKRRDEAAFEELVREYSGRLLGLAKRILGDEELARDAVQESFLNAYRAIDGFNEDARIGTWLHRIVVNAALGTMRRRKRRPESYLEEAAVERLGGYGLGDESLRERSADFEPGDERIARRQVRYQVQDCLTHMKDNHRAVLTLRYLQEYDTEQTAQILGIAPNTVKTRLLRARDALRQIIEHEREIASALMPIPAHSS